MALLIITALASESNLLLAELLPWEQRLLPGGALWNRLSDRLFLLRTGVGLARANRALEEMPREEFKAVLNLGFAGGVSDHLKMGSLFVAENYGLAGKPQLQPLPWRDSELQVLGLRESAVERGLLWTVEQALRSAEDRQRLRRQGVMAVDMESYAVAAYCLQYDLPLLTLRIITDSGGDQALAEFRRNYRRLGPELQRRILPYLRSRL